MHLCRIGVLEGVYIDARGVTWAVERFGDAPRAPHGLGCATKEERIAPGVCVDADRSSHRGAQGRDHFFAALVPEKIEVSVFARHDAPEFSLPYEGQAVDLKRSGEGGVGFGGRNRRGSVHGDGFVAEGGGEDEVLLEEVGVEAQDLGEGGFVEVEGDALSARLRGFCGGRRGEEKQQEKENVGGSSSHDGLGVQSAARCWG